METQELTYTTPWDEALEKTTSTPEKKAAIKRAILATRQWEAAAGEHGVVRVENTCDGSRVTLGRHYSVQPQGHYATFAVIDLPRGFPAVAYDVGSKRSRKLSMEKLAQRVAGDVRGWN